MPKKCQMNKTIYYCQYPFPIGKIMIACKDQAIIYCGQPILLENGIYENTECLKNIAKQIEEYFQKRRQSFDFHDRQYTSSRIVFKLLYGCKCGARFPDNYNHIFDQCDRESECR